MTLRNFFINRITVHVEISNNVGPVKYRLGALPVQDDPPTAAQKIAAIDGLAAYCRED